MGYDGPVDSPYHFPPEFLELLVETIPRLVRGKEQVLTFFRNASVDERLLADLRAQLRADPKSLNKFKIARSVLVGLNEAGDAAVQPRRQVVRSIEEWEDFSGSYDNDRLEAEAFVAKVRKLRHVKDSFTRMNIEREREQDKNKAAYQATVEAKAKRASDLVAIRDRLAACYGASDPHGRGKRLESVLNDLFSVIGISVSEAFHVVGPAGEGVVEQIDGAVRLRERLHLVEMKWWNKPLGFAEVASLTSKVFLRPECGGILIVEPTVTAPVLNHLHEAIVKGACIITVDLQEIYQALSAGQDVKDLLLSRLDRAVLHKQPR